MLTPMASRPHPLRRQIWRWPLLIILTGCAGMPLQPQAPTVSLTGFEPVQLGLAEQRFRVRLQLHNPNSFALPIHSIDYVLRLNDQPFAQGSSAQPVTVPALGDSSLELLVSGNLGGVLGPALALGAGQPLRYDLSGGVALAASLLRIPFRQEGELSLHGWRRDGQRF